MRSPHNAPGRKPYLRPGDPRRSLAERVAEAMRLNHHDGVVGLDFAAAEPDIRAYWLGKSDALIAELDRRGVFVALAIPPARPEPHVGPAVLPGRPTPDVGPAADIDALLERELAHAV